MNNEPRKRRLPGWPVRSPELVAEWERDTLFGEFLIDTGLSECHSHDVLIFIVSVEGKDTQLSKLTLYEAIKTKSWSNFKLYVI